MLPVTPKDRLAFSRSCPYQGDSTGDGGRSAGFSQGATHLICFRWQQTQPASPSLGQQARLAHWRERSGNSCGWKGKGNQAGQRRFWHCETLLTELETPRFHLKLPTALQFWLWWASIQFQTWIDVTWWSSSYCEICFQVGLKPDHKSSGYSRPWMVYCAGL